MGKKFDRFSHNFKLRYNREQAKTLTTKSMFTYSKVLNQVKNLTLADKRRLSEHLKKLIQLWEEVAEDDEVISAEEIADSEAAWEDYQAKRDRGYPPKNLRSTSPSIGSNIVKIYRINSYFFKIRC